MFPTCTYIGHVDGDVHRKALARIAELEAAINAFLATYEGMACYGSAAQALKKLATQN